MQTKRWQGPGSLEIWILQKQSAFKLSAPLDWHLIRIYQTRQGVQCLKETHIQAWSQRSVTHSGWLFVHSNLIAFEFPFSLVNRSSAKNDPRFTCEKRQGGNTCGHILFLPVGREGCSCDSLAALSGIEGRDPCIKKNSCLCFAFPSAPPVCVICHSWLCMRFLSLPLSFSLVALP